VDRITKKERSKNMAAIRWRDNISTEVRLMKLFRDKQVSGWRRHVRNVSGKPDFIFLKPHVAVFVDGCFWHGCRKHRRIPQTNVKFWTNKIESNRLRDKRNSAKLRRGGWKVIRIWEHEIKKNPKKTVAKIENALKI